VAACLLNFVPYIGSFAIPGASVIVGFIQFGRVDMALWIGGVSVGLYSLTGQ
jgi:predicted PurR-regulated permease PerM